MIIAAALLLPRPVLAVDTSAAAHMLMEVSTGRVLDCKNEDARLPMASTTKILTGLLTAERCDMDEVVTVEPEAAGVEGTSMYLKAGETLTVRDLLYGLMISSGNDAAVMLAIHMGGTVENFCTMMNERARELGAENSNFASPNGLPNEAHYTTAADLARIACAAMKNGIFRKVVGTQSIDLPADADSPARHLRSKNKILYQYDGGTGVKTGFTKAAGKCLVASAKRDGMELVAVVLNDYTMFPDCISLLDHGFANWKLRSVASDGTPMGDIKVKNGVADSVGTKAVGDLLLPLTDEEVTMINSSVNTRSSIAAPVAEGEKTGDIVYRIGANELGRQSVVTTGAVSENTYRYNIDRVLRRWLVIQGEN